MGDQTNPITVSDAPKNWKDYTTDPGFVAVLGFITLLLGLILMAFVPSIKDIYAYFGGSVVGLVGGHAWTDSKKTQYMCEGGKEDK